MSTAGEFRDHLSAFSDFYSSLGPPNPDTVPEDGKLKSEMMMKDNRRYYLDLKENSRGRFLRVSQTITRGGPRSQVAIPAQGMIEFRDALTDLLDEFSCDEHSYKPDLPEGRHLHVDNKNFYFDVGQNNRGVYMRISEVKTNFRTAITVPEKSWPRFRDIMADYCDKVKQQAQDQQPLVSSIISFLGLFENVYSSTGQWYRWPTTRHGTQIRRGPPKTTFSYSEPFLQPIVIRSLNYFFIMLLVSKFYIFMTLRREE